MLDIKAIELKKIVKKKKYPQMINILKKFLDAIIITKHILDLKINLTVGKLLTSTLTVEKQLTKIIFEDETI